jgi:putative membrane protein
VSSSKTRNFSAPCVSASTNRHAKTGRDSRARGARLLLERWIATKLRGMVVAILITWAAATLGLWVAARVLRGVQLASFGDAVWAGALLGVLQWALAGPLFVLLGIGTLGVGFLLWFLTRWIVAALVVLIASRLSSRFEVRGFFNALVTSFIVAVMGSVVRWVV